MKLDVTTAWNAMENHLLQSALLGAVGLVRCGFTVLAIRYFLIRRISRLIGQCGSGGRWQPDRGL